MGTHIQVQMTFPTAESAEATASRLVDERLAACAQILEPIQSVYVWKEKRESTREILVFAKTKAELFDRLVETVKEIHPYECPQIVALPIVAANKDYLVWIDEQTD